MSRTAFSRLSLRLMLTAAVVTATAAVAAPLRAEWAPTPRFQGSLCADGIARQERALGIPRRLLAAISLAESGRWDDSIQEIVAWPWTVMAEGEGRYLATKAQAVAEVRALQKRGVTNIDVGCMQINLQHHPDAFASLEEAFDPAANTAYAGRFLASLRDEAGSWPRAAAFYHSRTPERAKAYGDKVSRLWAGLEGKGQNGTAAAKRLARALPGEESVFEDIFLDPPAERSAPPAKRVATIPVDHERTAAFNDRWRGRGLAPRGVDQALPSRVATGMNPDAARRSSDSFAAKRQEQLARWRRDGRL